MQRTTRRTRAKVSATLEPQLIKRVAAYQREAGLPTFSAALEDLLWRQLMDERARAYYQSMTPEEHAEQEAWAKLSSGQFFKSVHQEQR